ncbi:MAG: hypothetical protein [aquatic viral metagenome]
MSQRVQRKYKYTRGGPVRWLDMVSSGLNNQNSKVQEKVVFLTKGSILNTIEIISRHPIRPGYYRGAYIKDTNGQILAKLNGVTIEQVPGSKRYIMAYTMILQNGQVDNISVICPLRVVEIISENELEFEVNQYA